MKSWKSLFVKSEEENAEKPASDKTQHSEFTFPPSSNEVQNNTSNFVSTPNDAVTNEIIEVYEKGLDSINMPGYDFYEFYSAINAAGSSGEQTYKMAFQMAKTLDNGLTIQKLLNDADFYISKINEVYNQYTVQGKAKLAAIQNERSSEISGLNNDVHNAENEIQALKKRIEQLQSEINTKKNKIIQLENIINPEADKINQKLSANDVAYNVCISKLNTVKQSISKYLK